MPQNPVDDKSVLVQVMAWCLQATSHYLSQGWPRSKSSYGITKPQWVNHFSSFWTPLIMNTIIIGLGKVLIPVSKIYLSLHLPLTKVEGRFIAFTLSVLVSYTAVIMYWFGDILLSFSRWVLANDIWVLWVRFAFQLSTPVLFDWHACLIFSWVCCV